MKARTVEDVILGEATYGTPEERFRDMLAIASVIDNRARKLGVTPEEVVAAPGQFSAYNRALPAGVDRYRALAKSALDMVKTNGPVHRATFYATPDAAGNLPSGLAQVGQTTGHIYFDDPANRPIRTSVGFRVPQAITAEYSPPYEMAATTGAFSPSMVPSANAGPAGRAYGDLVPPTQVETTSQPATFSTPTYNPDRQQAAIDYSPLSAGGVQRNQRPDESFMGGIGDAVAGYFGPGYSVSVASGKGVMRNPDGSVSKRGNHNHPSGFAADFDVIGPDGQQVGPARMADFGAYAASQGFTGVGVGPGYMEPGRMHLDVVHHNPTAWGAGGVSANMDPALHEAITQAGAFGAPLFGAGLPENVPTPENRPLPDTLMASAPDYQTVATKQAPVGDQGGVIGASFSPPQQDAPAPDIGVSGSAQGMFGPPGAMSGSFTAPNGEIGFKGGGIGFKGGAIGAPANKDLSGIGAALDATRQAADMGQPAAPNTFDNMLAGMTKPAPPNLPQQDLKPAYAINADIVAPVPNAAPANMVSPDPGLFSNTPMSGMDFASFPKAPAAPSTWDKAKPHMKTALKDALIGGKMLGVPGMLGGFALGMSPAFGADVGFDFGPQFDEAMPESERFSTGFGLKGIESAMHGPRGATGTASNGSTYTSLGNGMGLRHSARYGWTEVVGPDGSVRGIHYNNGAGGIFGDISRALEGFFGGDRDGGFSKAERDRYSKGVGLY